MLPSHRNFTDLGYLKNIGEAIATSAVGLKLSLGHFFQAVKSRKQDVMSPDYFSTDKGTATLQFPHESIPVPDKGRYKLHNEMDDCNVCDKCAKVCPVNCIEIVPIRSADAFGETSDGTSKRIYAEKFDIDMAKCMFCGLCTTVCPTECLTMTGEYDYSTFDIRDHLFPFGNMTYTEVVEKKKDWEAHQEAKAAAMPIVEKPSAPSEAKPVFKPRPMPSIKPKTNEDAPTEIAKPKPVFKPRMMPPKPNPKTDE